MYLQMHNLLTYIYTSKYTNEVKYVYESKYTNEVKYVYESNTNTNIINK